MGRVLAQDSVIGYKMPKGRKQSKRSKAKVSSIVHRLSPHEPSVLPLTSLLPVHHTIRNKQHGVREHAQSA